MSRRILPVVFLAMIAAACSAGVSTTESNRNTPSTAAETTAPDDAPATTEPDDTAPDSTLGEVEPDVALIEWGVCTDEEAQDPALECATLTVPLDFDNPSGEAIDLALVRAPATGNREGAVLFNPGGPGGSGFDPIAINGTFIQESLGLENFDLIGFDPRGVERSNGIRCLTDEQVNRFMYLDYSPDTPEEQALVDEEENLFATQCQAKYGDTLGFYSTENTARDMDMIRAGLGDEKLSFLGISYGTYLGAVYATLFPDRVRAFVLDSAFEPGGDSIEEQYLTQAVGFEEAFNNWVEYCQTDTTCPFTAPDVAARFDALIDQLDATPIPAEDGRLGNNAVAERATTAALYSESEWPVLASALADAEAGDPAGIFALADSYNGRNPDGTTSTLFQSYTVITCASGIQPDPVEDPQALLDALIAQAPRQAEGVTVDDFSSESDQCNDLMAPAEEIELSYSGDGLFVVVGGTNDPATPVRWAEEMDAALGETSALVYFTGEGHGQLLVSTCVTDIEAALLADLQLPDDPTTCDPDPPLEEPSWWSTIPVPDGVGEAVELPAVDASLGIVDTQFYSETRLTSASVDEVSEAYATALEEAGFESLGEGSDLGVNDARNDVYSIDGELLLVVTLGSSAFDTEDFASGRPDVPDGQTVVMLLFLPE